MWKRLDHSDEEWISVSEPKLSGSWVFLSGWFYAPLHVSVVNIKWCVERLSVDGPLCPGPGLAPEAEWVSVASTGPGRRLLTVIGPCPPSLSYLHPLPVSSVIVTRHRVASVMSDERVCDNTVAFRFSFVPKSCADILYILYWLWRDSWSHLTLPLSAMAMFWPLNNIIL